MEIAYNQIIGAALAIGVRVSGIVLFAPFFGSAAIPARLKAVLIILITALLYPVYAPHLQAVEYSHWPMLIGKELMVGVAMGIATNLVFDAVQMAGQVLSIQIGYSLVNILDPQTQVESTVVALFHQTIAMLIFLRLNVHHWILRAVSNSFDVLPFGTANLNGNFTAAALNVGSSVFGIGLQIAAPVLCATLIADIVIGFLGKASPQMPLMLLGPAVKSMLGLLVLVSAMSYWPNMFDHLFANSIGLSERLLQLAK